MPRSVICSPIHMMNAVPVVSVIITMNRKPHPGFITIWIRSAAERLKSNRSHEALEKGQGNRQVAGVLGNLLASQLPFFGELFQVGDDDGGQLQNNRGRNIRHDPQGENAESPQGAAGKDVQKSENGARIAPRNSCSSASWFIPGVGINAPTR